MIVQLTDVGAALITANRGPIQISTFKLGSASGYIPLPTDTDIHGSVVFNGNPSQYFVVNANVVKYSVYLSYDLGPFKFGEIGLFTSDGKLFALAANDVLLSKIPLGQTGNNSIRADIYLSMVGTNYEMWLDYAESSNQFHMAVLGSVDQLPPPSQATPNAYIVSGASAGQSAYLAYTDRQGLWNFDAYAYANQRQATITAFDAQSVTIANADFVPAMISAYFGQVIVEFASGQNYGICRYVKNVVQSSTSVTINFDNPLMQLPIVGDKIIVFARQQLTTTIPNLPIATDTQLGGIKVGTTLTITADGVLNVAPTAFPVTSVNGMTGDVVLTATDIQGLARVAITGKYSDLLGAPGPYSLPIATTTVLGGVKAPSNGNLTVAGDGTIDLGFAPVKTVNGTGPDGSGNVQLSIPDSVIGLITPKNIPAASDLNTYQTTGMFFILDADAATIQNMPGTSGGVLDIEPFTTTATGGDVIQRFTSATSISLRRYTKSNNGWTSWQQMQTTAGLPIASKTQLGIIQVGTGLNVTSQGLLSTVIQSVNGHSEQDIVLTSIDVGAIPNTAYDQQAGVPQLDSSANPNTATDPYTFGRMQFWQNTLGTWWNAGSWDASTNAISQFGGNPAIFDTGAQLLPNGQQTIDISYGGKGRNTIVNPDYQTVSGEGQVYQVAVAGTTDLDGTNQWDVGDLVVGVNGKWTKITVNFTNVIFSAGTF
jgi:hypothetical protein